MSMTEHPKDKKFTAIEALSMACAIYRCNGYTNTSTYLVNDPNGEQRWNNKDHLIYQMMPSLAHKEYNSLFKVKREDLDIACDIVKFYRKLSFGVLGGELNDYMQRVFSSTQNEMVGLNELGIIASIPKIYERDIQEKFLKDEAKKTIQEYIGQEGETVTLNIRYLRTKYIEKIECYAHEAVTSTNYLVNFLSKKQLGSLGDEQQIQARVKKHTQNYTTKTAETQLNYVKVLDNGLVWQ
jgi:hypothetical protein